jgi:RND superfamily putative drug exporter
MAELLYRVGHWSARHSWRVIGAWLLALVAATLAFLFGHGTLATGFDIPGTRTAEVTRTLDEKIPGLSGGNGTVVLRTLDGSPIDAEQRAAISQLVQGAQGLPHVAAVVDPFATEEQRAQQAAQLVGARQQVQAALANLPEGPAGELARQSLLVQQQELDAGEQLLRLAEDVRMVSADGSAAMVAVSFDQDRLTLAPEAKKAAKEYFLGHPIDGLVTDVSVELAESVPSIVGPGEIVGVVVAGIVLVVMLGTLIGAGLPIVTALLGLGIGALITLSLSSVLQVASVTPVLGVMLGLAVGIDYALFIVNRHRRQLARSLTPDGSLTEASALPESIGLANGTAGNAVVFAGSTVLVALLALNITGIPFLGLMGSVGALCVALAVLVSVTLTPALLGLIGPRIVGRRLRRRMRANGHATKPARAIPTALAILGVVVGAVGLAVVAVPYQSLRLGIPDGSAEAQDSTQYRTYRAVADHFGAGVNGPLLVTATVPGRAREATVVQTQASVASRLAEFPSVVAVAPVGATSDGTFLAFQIVPAEGPTSESTEALVRDLRAASPLADGTVLGVAGQATGNIDISDKLSDVLPTYLALVIGLSALIMVFVFRSLLLPVIATAGFLLTIFATYGALVAIYQWGWLSGIFGVHDPGPLMNFLPIILVGVLFGLAMDYQLFLGSGMREAYVHGTPARVAVVSGLRAGRAVVTAAGIIMVAVFSGFIAAETVVVRPLGFGLAFGVLVDAFVVRMVIVPGLLHLLGRAAWWLPRWLDRILPNVDIEGAALERRHEHAPTPTFAVVDRPRVPVP